MQASAYSWFTANVFRRSPTPAACLTRPSPPLSHPTRPHKAPDLVLDAGVAVEAQQSAHGENQTQLGWPGSLRVRKTRHNLTLRAEPIFC